MQDGPWIFLYIILPPWCTVSCRVNILIERKTGAFSAGERPLSTCIRGSKAGAFTFQLCFKGNMQRVSHRDIKIKREDSPFAIYSYSGQKVRRLNAECEFLDLWGEEESIILLRAILIYRLRNQFLWRPIRIALAEEIDSFLPTPMHKGLKIRPLSSSNHR